MIFGHAFGRINQAANIFKNGDYFRPARGEEQRVDLVDGKMLCDDIVGKHARGFLFRGAVMRDCLARFGGVLVRGKVHAADGFKPEQSHAF